MCARLGWHPGQEWLEGVCACLAVQGGRSSEAGSGSEQGVLKQHQQQSQEQESTASQSQQHQAQKQQSKQQQQQSQEQHLTDQQQQLRQQQQQREWRPGLQGKADQSGAQQHMQSAFFLPAPKALQALWAVATLDGLLPSSSLSYAHSEQQHHQPQQKQQHSSVLHITPPPILWSVSGQNAPDSSLVRTLTAFVREIKLVAPACSH